MKHFNILLLIALLFLIAGCSDDDYANSSNWSVTNEEFKNDYYQFYLTNITTLAKQYNIDIEVQIKEKDDRRYQIIYNSSDYFIYFNFNNDTAGYGSFSSYYTYFNENIEELFDYSKHEKMVSFVSDVNSIVSFDYHGGKETYHNLYTNYLAHETTSYKYHFDEVVGYLSYQVTCGNNYSKEETRWNITFRYHSLLKPII